MAGTASDVRDVDTLPEPVNQPWDERQRHADQGCIVNGAAIFSNESLEPRECGIRNSAAMVEAIHDLIFNHRQQPNVLRLYRKIVQTGSPGEPGGMIGEICRTRGL